MLCEVLSMGPSIRSLGVGGGVRPHSGLAPGCSGGGRGDTVLSRNPRSGLCHRERRPPRVRQRHVVSTPVDEPWAAWRTRCQVFTVGVISRDTPWYARIQVNVCLFHLGVQQVTLLLNFRQPMPLILETHIKNMLYFNLRWKKIAISLTVIMVSQLIVPVYGY